MNALVYVDMDWGIHKGKLKNAPNEKRKKLRGFSFSKNMANFEAFCRTKKLISNLFFLESVLVCSLIIKRIKNLEFFMLTKFRHSMFNIHMNIFMGAKLAGAVGALAPIDFLVSKSRIYCKFLTSRSRSLEYTIDSFS